MSGLEGIAGLGLACNIMQLISFSHETVVICRRIHENGTPEPDLAEQAKSLKDLSDDLERSLKGKASASSGAPADKRVLDLARKCIRHAKDLNEEIVYLTPSHPGKVAALVATPKAIWRKRRLERLKTNLADAQKLIETSILVRLFGKIDDSFEKNEKAFNGMSQQLKDFIHTYSQNSNLISKLVRDESKATRDHVTIATTQTRKEINSQITKELKSQEESINHTISISGAETQQALSHQMAISDAAIARERARQRLLASLKYARMNERKNDLKPAHLGTCQWIFGNSRCRDDSASDWVTEDESTSEYTNENSDEISETGKEDEKDSDIETAHALNSGLYLGSLKLGDDVSRVSEIRDSDSDNDSVRANYYGGSERSFAWSSTTGDANNMGDSDELQMWDNFVEWLQGNERTLYWISGKPGSGKSTLMKFIESSDDTYETLKGWHSDTKVLSHYLWKPGSWMQQSIKGLCCSLLHQVLERDAELSDTLLTTQPELGMKDSDTDWTIGELRHTLVRLFECSTYTYFVLLDGLDEVAATTDEGPEELLMFLKKLILNEKVKICVSSRPEPAFERHLGQFPMLRRQDLTRRDIEKYTEDFLQSIWTQIDKAPTDMLEIVVRKADGVFLWVVLALQSVKRGFNNFDNWDTLCRRINTLPGDLKSLYKDMWSRSNGDSVYYLKEAALYFRLVISHQAISKKDSINVLELATAANDDCLAAFTQSVKAPDVAKILRTTYDKVHFWAKARVSFTHKTAIDFLVDDEDGRKIFEAYEPEPEETISRLVKRDLMLLSLFNWLNLPDSPLVEAIKYRLATPKVGISDATLNSLVSLTHRWSKTYWCPPEDLSQDHFFIAAAASSGYSDYIIRYLDARQADSDLNDMKIFVLKGACARAVGFCKFFGSYNDPPQLSKNRQILIQKILSKHASCLTKGVDSDEDLESLNVGTSQSLLQAWRCFLIHSLERICAKRVYENRAEQSGVLAPDGTYISNIIEAFASTAIVAKSSSQKYIPRLGISGKRPFIATLVDRASEGLTEVVFFEVNDAFILNLIWTHLLGKKRSIGQKGPWKTEPFVKTIMFGGYIRKSAYNASIFAKAISEEADDDWDSKYYTPNPNFDLGDNWGLAEELLPFDASRRMPFRDKAICQSRMINDEGLGVPRPVRILQQLGYQPSDLDGFHSWGCVHEYLPSF
ncbi:uncharacterized protein CTRU02_212296 [Colletotrichum truncatum]|uniref:Uncharacterized protein n=1 Tax=Colletotrichum truncatum TaxID=5467 RepID=A0ACC3YN51_COLTU|nr:uncharacterized protein CTRU02_08824 [Colletotrichum truncatum]KAF6789577.1 hypothetical protein CTRU02_08824 [Colletotrichum truncatum]